MSTSTTEERSPRARDAGRTRQALLAAAAELFGTRGFGGTTVEEIARRAGANKAMVSYHFGGKAAIYEEILASAFEHASKEVQAILDSGLPPDAMLGRFAETFFGLVRERPHFPAIMIREAMSGGVHMTDRVLPHFVGVFVRVRSIVERGIEQGVFRPVDPVLTHLALMGSLLFFAASEPMRTRLIRERKVPIPGFPEPDDYVRNLKDLLVRGLRAETASSVSPVRPA